MASAPCALPNTILSYNAKVHPHLPKLNALLDGLQARSGVKPKVVIIHHADAPSNETQYPSEWMTFDEFVKIGQEKKLGRTSEGEIKWAMLPFDWPLWILFSSGTTGEFKVFCHKQQVYLDATLRGIVDLFIERF